MSRLPVGNERLPAVLHERLTADLHERLRRLPADIRLEVILADLVEEGMSMDEIVVINASLSKRNYHRDVEGLTDHEYGQSKKKKLYVVVNREGIYDKLPEDLFHQPASAERTGTEYAISETSIQREIERSARLFFRPIENELYRHRVDLEAEERNFLFETSGPVAGEIFDYLWDLPDFLSNSQKSKVGAIIPIVHTVVGRMAEVSVMIGRITGDGVGIRISSPCDYLVDDASVLGSMQLGINMLLGGRVAEWQSSVTLTITPSNMEELTAYLPGGRRWVVYEYLAELLLPAENEVVFELDLSGSGHAFIIDAEMDHLGRLHYTTHL